MRNKAFYFASYEYQKLGATVRPNTGYPQFDVDLPADTTSHFTTARVDVQPNNAHRLFGRFRAHYRYQADIADALENVGLIHNLDSLTSQRFGKR